MESDKIQVTTGTGLCSCLTVRVHDACQYAGRNGRYPKEIDSSKQYELYKEYAEQRIDSILMNDYVYNPDLLIMPFDHGWQYGWYDQIRIAELKDVALTICPISAAVGDKSYQYMQEMGSRTAVLYRGNDKVKEIPAAPYKSMIEMALATGSTSFLVQTDEAEFYNTFKEVFPDTIRFEDIGMINRNFNAYYLPANDHAGFCVNFLAALRAIGHAEKFITTTGNTGLWAMIFRGHTRNTWQFNGNSQNWRKLI